MKRLPRWRLTQTAAIRLLFAIAIILASALMSRGQVPDPFDDSAFDDVTFDDVTPDTAPLADPTAADPTPTATPTTDTDTVEDVAEPVAVRPPVVEAVLDSINARDPQSPAELLGAVYILQQLGANDEAKTFLERITNQSLTVDQLVEVHKEIGTGTLARIANNKQLGPAVHQLVRRVFAAVRLTKRDPERLNGLIAALANEDAEQRRAAMMGLAEAGGHAIPALLNAYRDPPDGVTPASLDASVVGVGSRAENPLIAALGAPDAYLQQTAARLLGRVGSERARTHLIRPFFSANNAVSRSAAASLKQLGMGRPESIESAAVFLSRQALRHLRGAPPYPAGLDSTLEMWTWSGEEKNVVPSRLTAREAAAVAAARMARDGYELNQTAESQRLLLVSRLMVDQLLGGVDEPLQRGAGTAYELSVKAGARAVSDVLAYSLANGIDAAAVGAAEVLGDLAETSAVVSPQPAPLVRALQAPSRRVRYAAARALMSIDPRTRYPGASHLIEALVDLADAKGRPAALIGTPRQEVSFQLAGLLGTFGIEPHRVLKSREFLEKAVQSSDYDVAFLSDSVNQPAVYEALQQLRKDPHSKYLPVVVMVRKGRLDHAEQLVSQIDNVIVMPEFADEQTLSETLTAVEKMVEPTSVSPQRRLAQAVDALQWLGHLAEYSQSYAGYDVMRAQPVAERSLWNAELTEPALELLGYLGSPSAQQLLVETASQNARPVEQRQRAANAFAESVLRRGLMLRKAEVARQYDRYNASETADAATQEILGQVLDVIETQTRPTAATRQ